MIIAASDARPEREQSSDDNVDLETERAQEFVNSRPNEDASSQGDEAAQKR